ncbi:MULTISPECIES: hypothetical protein [unclassified Methylobacterium]|uniref:hypothetical protein n=1 Tax=unclassified Methylobacterium TaxID=2615210 RepID=UPI00165090F3|nr:MULTISPECIES: hypothetical protein [unclassified Methylobacterium]
MSGLLTSTGLLREINPGILGVRTILSDYRDTNQAALIMLPPRDEAAASHAAILELHGLSPRLPMPAIGRAPAYRPWRQPIHVFTDRQTRRHRDMALWVHRVGGNHLSASERRFVGEAIKWKRELSITQADWLTEIVDRLDMLERGL